MKAITVTIAAILLLLIGAVCAGAADLDGHMKYTIKGYSFSIDPGDSLFDHEAQSLLITESKRDVLNESMKGSADFGIADPRPTTDILALSAEFEATPDLSVLGAVGISKNKLDFTFDPEYNASWEANVGVIYKLFNNISYEVHFGYMETGDLFRDKDIYTDVEKIIMISNQLTMSF